MDEIWIVVYQSPPLLSVRDARRQVVDYKTGEVHELLRHLPYLTPGSRKAAEFYGAWSPNRVRPADDTK